MTRERFIRKWLGNKDYQYTEENRNLMRDDLDEVINQALPQADVIKSVCDECGGSGRWKDDELDNEIDCPKCADNQTVL